MTREEFDNLLVELSGAHVKWDTRFKLLAAYDDLTTQRDNFRARCADLESRLDIGTGNMYDDEVTAHAMRHVVEGVGRIAREALDRGETKKEVKE